jgi:tRNA(fMet)-specific endonuclease VapC
MILLDTDHVTLLKYPSSDRGARLRQRLDAVPAGEVIAVSVIVVEEQMRGWLATIARERSIRRQVPAYRELADLFEFFAEFDIAAFDDRAVEKFEELRTAKLRLGTMDRKIAAIALANQAVLLSANRSHFGRVPGLRLENWLD